MIDAIDQLISLYDNQDNFIQAFIESTLFLPPDIVQARNDELIELYKTGGKFPVRYSPSFNEVWNIKNKAEGITFSKHNDARLPLYPSFNVCVDKDGNCENRRQIKLRLNQTVSIGKNSTIINYIISHVWGLASHPLFFSSLWNIVLVPAHFNYLMDKDPESHEVVRKIKAAVQRQCILLYEPYKSLIKQIPEVEEFRDLLFSDSIVQEETNYNIHFLTDEGVTSAVRKISLSDEERDLIEALLNRMGKKFFLDYYEAYLSGEDLMNVIPIGVYTYDSVRTRIITMKRIFREDLNVKALIYILEKQNSKLDDTSIHLARELLELS